MALGWFGKLKQGLGKSSDSLSESLKDVFIRRKLDNEMCEALEDSLIQGDIGVETAMRIVENLRTEKFDQEITENDVRIHLADQMATTLKTVEAPLEISSSNKPHVILMVGVNGSGKTTTIGKLTAKFKAEGKSVMLAAGDTFRAGAVEQLAVWANRNNVPIVKPAKEGADPAGVLFTAHEAAIKKNMDILIADTAGRLGNRKELMDELRKIAKVLKKQDESAPHNVILVLDATVGQNAHMQVDAFTNTAGVTGLIMTKLDGSAKGGVIVSLAEKYNLPIHFIGIGEAVDDLRVFEAQPYANALMDVQQNN